MAERMAHVAVITETRAHEGDFQTLEMDGNEIEAHCCIPEGCKKGGIIINVHNSIPQTHEKN